MPWPAAVAESSPLLEPAIDDARPWRGGLWLNALCLLLLGYALFGKGAGYIGIPPLFVGEFILLLGMLWFIFRARWETVLDTPHIWLILALAAWGALRTWPYLSRYGLEALRDAAIWGYSAFAVLVLAYIRADPRRLLVLLRRFRTMSWLFPLLIPWLWLICYRLGTDVPQWPWTQGPMIDAKAGDILVHLGGIVAFWVTGLGGGGVGAIPVILLTATAAVMGAYERSGLLAFLAACGACVLFRWQNPILRRFLVIGVLGFVFLALLDVRFDIPAPVGAKEREFSLRALSAGLWSIGGYSEMSDLDDTKQWRLDWWTTIQAYTVDGEYFWTGKGFGINLASDDGFQVRSDNSLRSPHNGHLTILARAGVPGLLLWTLVQAAWGLSVFLCLLRSRRQGQDRWSGLLLFLLAYWMAFLINAAFDVFLEGPMGGIWFWSFYGFGLAAMWVHRHCPELLCDDENPASA